MKQIRNRNLSYLPAVPHSCASVKRTAYMATGCFQMKNLFQIGTEKGHSNLNGKRSTAIFGNIPRLKDMRHNLNMIFGVPQIAKMLVTALNPEVKRAMILW